MRQVVYSGRDEQIETFNLNITRHKLLHTTQSSQIDLSKGNRKVWNQVTFYFVEASLVSF